MRDPLRPQRRKEERKRKGGRTSLKVDLLRKQLRHSWGSYPGSLPLAIARHFWAIPIFMQISICPASKHFKFWVDWNLDVKSAQSGIMPIKLLVSLQLTRKETETSVQNECTRSCSTWTGHDHRTKHTHTLTQSCTYTQTHVPRELAHRPRQLHICKRFSGGVLRI